MKCLCAQCKKDLGFLAGRDPGALTFCGQECVNRWFMDQPVPGFTEGLSRMVSSGYQVGVVPMPLGVPCPEAQPDLTPVSLDRGMLSRSICFPDELLRNPEPSGARLVAEDVKVVCNFRVGDRVRVAVAHGVRKGWVAGAPRADSDGELWCSVDLECEAGLLPVSLPVSKLEKLP